MLLAARGAGFFAFLIAGAFALAAGCRPAETFHPSDAAGGPSVGSGGSGGLPIGVGTGGDEFDAGQGGGSGGSGGSAGEPGGSGGAAGEAVDAGGGGSGGAPSPGDAGGGERVDAGTDRPADARVDRGDTGADLPVETAPERPAEVAAERPVATDVPPGANRCDRANWKLTVNYLCDTALCLAQSVPNKDPAGAIDSDLGTRYTTGRLQGSTPTDEMVTIDFGGTVTLGGVRLRTSSVGDGPAEYRVEYTTDLVSPPQQFTPEAAGGGADDLEILFAPTAMRTIRIIQTGAKEDNWWSIHDLTAIGCRN